MSEHSGGAAYRGRPPVRVGRANNTFQHLEVLKRNRTRRRQYGEFFAEGVRPIQRLVANGWTVRCVCSEDGRTLSLWAESIIEGAGAARHYLLAPELMKQLSDREEPSELLLVAAMRNLRLQDLTLPDDFLVVVLDRPISPGNLGTVIRSADALGADAVLIAGHAADPYDPRSIRASMGSLFSLPVLEIGGPAELEPWLSSLTDVNVLGTDSTGDTLLADVDLRQPTILVVGNEGAGASHGLLGLCRTVARIPMIGSADSLNMAVAASIALYEAATQRGVRGSRLGVS
jgi:23S rRNA (uridine2479-2'-O)-methyltransferase